MCYAHANHTHYIQTDSPLLAVWILHVVVLQDRVTPPSRGILSFQAFCHFKIQSFCTITPFSVFSCLQMCFHYTRSSTCGTHCCWETPLSPFVLAWPYCNSSGTVFWPMASMSAFCCFLTYQVRVWAGVKIFINTVSSLDLSAQFMTYFDLVI